MFSRIVKSLACLEGTVSIHAVEIAMHANMYLMSLHAFMHGIHTCMHGPWMSSHTHIHALRRPHRPRDPDIRDLYTYADINLPGHMHA